VKALYDPLDLNLDLLPTTRKYLSRRGASATVCRQRNPLSIRRLDMGNLRLVFRLRLLSMSDPSQEGCKPLPSLRASLGTGPQIVGAAGEAPFPDGPSNLGRLVTLRRRSPEKEGDRTMRRGPDQRRAASVWGRADACELPGLVIVGQKAEDGSAGPRKTIAFIATRPRCRAKSRRSSWYSAGATDDLQHPAR